MSEVLFRWLLCLILSGGAAQTVAPSTPKLEDPTSSLHGEKRSDKLTAVRSLLPQSCLSEQVDEKCPEQTDDASDATSLAGEHVETEAIRVCIYACRRCRRALFLEKDLMIHDSLHSEYVNFKGKGWKDASQACTSYFLAEPPPSSFDCSDSSGKLMCPKCSTRIGSYNWAGTQCSCGQWIVPALQIVKSKVDIKRRILHLPSSSRASVKMLS